MQKKSDAPGDQSERSAPLKPHASSPSDPPVNSTELSERLKRLASDPNYPNPEIVKSMAHKLLDLFRSE
jgi:hypothetical protein